MKVLIDLQHCGKPSRRDLGAQYNGRVEYDLLAQYGVYAQLRLNKLGHRTFLNGMGEYRDRAIRANSLKLNLAVLCHVNCMPEGKHGQGRTGKIFIDYRTTDTNRRRAKIAAEYLDGISPWNIVVQECRPDDWTRNAFYCMKYYKAWTWVLEPFFIDNEHQMSFLDGRLQQFGNSVGSAIDAAYKKP